MVRADVVEKKIARAAAWLDSSAAAYARPVDELRADDFDRLAAHGAMEQPITTLRRFFALVGAQTDRE